MSVSYDLNDCLERVDEVGLFPKAAMRILHLTRSPSATLDDLEGAVAMDGILAGRVLKVANSPLFGRRVRIGTLRHAVQMLGFSGTRDLAIALAVSGVTQDKGPWGENLWRHAEATAWTCRVLGSHIRRMDPDAMFVAGLLHDLGQQLLLGLERDRTTELLDQFEAHSVLILKAETMHHGFNHAQLGAACLRRWKLPLAAAELVELHHQPVAEAGPQPSDARARATLEISDAVAEPLLNGMSADDLLGRAQAHSAYEHLHLAQGAVLGAFEQLVEHRSELFSD